MARNVQEFVPDIQKFGFDLATNRFYFKGKPDTTESRLMAGVEIKRILSNSDVRVASISRSTLARAAITFEAMDGKEIDASKVAEPVLYKRKTTAEDLHKEIPKSPYRKLAIEIYKSDRQDSQTRVDAVGGFFDKRAGGRKDWTNPADVTAAVRQGVEEVKFMLTQEKSGLDWYEQDIARAFKETQRFIPSLKIESQRRLFSAVAGIKSPQTNARDNWHIAAQGFAHLKSTGTLSGVNPETGSLWQGGTTSTIKKKQLEMLNSMIQDIGESAATDWLFSEHTVKELNAARKKWGNMGPGVDGKAADMRLGLRAFGPKIGPFVMNINGIHGVTVDIWMNRTFNRWFGSMLDDSGAMVDAPTEPQRKSITKMVERIAMQTGIKPYQVQSVLWFFEQGVYKRIGTNAESYGFSDGAKKYSDYRDGRGDSANGGGVESGQNVRGSNADEDGGAATGGALSFKRKQTEAPEFKKWFGDSKVVDADGNPLVVYHGTKAPPTQFEKSRTGMASTFLGDYEVERHGIFAAEDPELADEYANQGERPTNQTVMPLFMSIKSPLDAVDGYYTDEVWANISSAAKRMGGENPYATARFIGDLWSRGALWKLFDADESNDPSWNIAMLKEAGYDGMRIYERSEGDVGNTAAWVAFEPEQVKSATGNNGNFDGTNPDIRYKRKEKSTAPAWVDEKIWELHEDALRADEEASGRVPFRDGFQGRPQDLKRNQTMTFRRLSKAVEEYIGQDWAAQNDLMVRMNEESARRDASAKDFPDDLVGIGVTPEMVDLYRDMRAKRDYIDSDPEFSTQAEKAAATKARTVFFKAIDGLGSTASTMAAIARYVDSQPRFKRKQPPRAPGLPGESKFMAVRRKLQDQYIQIRELQDMLTARGGVVGEAQDVYRAEERMHGRAQELLTDFSRNQIEPFVAKAAKMGVSLDEVALYAYAKHAEERNAYIKSINPKIGDAGSGMSDAHAQNIIQMVKLAGDDQKFDELHQDLMGITATTRRVLLDEGLITQEEYDGWEGLYENYVPLRGFEDVNHETATPLRGTGRGFSMTGKESVKALGRTSKAGDILENILRDYERAVIRSEKNAVAKTFLDLATSNPDPDLWEVQPVKTNRSFNKASGMVLMTNTPDTGDETIAIKVAGQQVRVKINDPLILRAMKQASKDETSQLERLLANTLGVYTNLMRNTLTRYNPIFGAINAVRDAQMGAVSAYDVLGAEGAKLYAKYLPVAMAASWRQERNKANPNGTMDKWIQEMRFAGGTTGGYHMRETSEITEAMRTLMLQAGATPNTAGEKVRASLAYQKAAAAMKWLEIVGSTSEDAARVAAYRAARELGKTPAEAASIAKNLTTNFNRKGEWGTTLNSLYLFFNAGVQGTTRVLEALGNRRVQYMMAGATAAAMALALLNAGQGDDDDGQNYWDKIPDFEKERNLIFMLPPGVEMDGAKQVGTRGRYIKIPVPYGINVFPVLGNQMADLVRYAKDPSQGVKPAKAAINLVSAVFGSINPFGGSMDPTNFNELAMAVSPTASDLGLQLGLGINSFGRPVGPEKSPFDDKPDSENFSARQAGTASQHVARWINSVTGGNEGRSGKVDIMPGTIDNFVRNTTGGLGVFLADTFVNLPTKIASPVEVTNRDVPLLRNFYGQIDEVTDVGLFYDRRATMTKEMKAAQAEMKLGVDVDYTPESVTMQTLGKAAEGYTKWMSALRKEEIAIAADDTLTKGDKMLKRRELEKQRGELAKSFNSMYNEEMKALK